MGAVSRDPGRRWKPRSLGGARARSRVSGSESWRSPGARWGLRRASGSRQAPPRSLTFAHQMRMVCGIFFAWECEGGVLSHNQTITGKGAIRDPARVSKLWEEPPSVLSGLGDVRVSIRRRARARRAGPRPWLPRAPLLSPSSGSCADPSPPSPGAQPSPARIRFRTLAAVAKDRRTPHHPLKIRPLALGTVLPARAGGDTGRQEGAPGPRGGGGARVAQAQGGGRIGSSGSGCTAPRRQRGLGCGRWDRGTGGKHRGARGSGERTCAEVRWERE